MNLIGTETIQTPRLILRRVALSDALSMYKNWASDKEVTKFLSWSPHKSPEETTRIIASWIDNYNDSSFFLWAIALEENNEIIGTIGAVKEVKDKSPIEIGYCLGKNFWNKGFMSESLKYVIKYFFEKVNASTIIAKHDIDNIPSGRIMEKNNMKFIKKVKEEHNKDGKISKCLFCYHKITKREWLKI